MDRVVVIPTGLPAVETVRPRWFSPLIRRVGETDQLVLIILLNIGKFGLQGGRGKVETHRAGVTVRD